MSICLQSDGCDGRGCADLLYVMHRLQDLLLFFIIHIIISPFVFLYGMNTIVAAMNSDSTESRDLQSRHDTPPVSRRRERNTLRSLRALLLAVPCYTARFQGSHNRGTMAKLESSQKKWSISPAFVLRMRRQPG
ncbi:hypothetical protein BDV41DRAFT_65439 [Aspergillus transmontanensis]|uniref:Uncharacterized protein n=1 Tax=Aspergillus transmontanensis TaxID=1034304 RepID=A0A5N6VG86_9EURO|nr:hypothetical protein BDV41DRAFT_65439 [Aspergillus transmontanensis]